MTRAVKREVMVYGMSHPYLAHLHTALPDCTEMLLVTGSSEAASASALQYAVTIMPACP
jgi:hypothetical protein